MKRKGFTLIELLAVIVILAIIMVIAVPQILNVIESSKNSAADSSIKLVKDAIRSQVTTASMAGVTFEKTGECYEFNFDNQESGNAKTLSLKNKERIGGSIKYCNGKFEEDSLTFDGTSSSNDEEEVVTKLCKRASTLHTETCTESDTTGCCSGAGYSTGTEITYGNLGTRGTLSSGDAFDCDVNGDGTYDSTTERFYYVTDLEGNSNVAVLIYYNNFVNGEANNTSAGLIAYDGTHGTGSSAQNWYGPVTAMTNLPTKSQWRNVSLTNSVRAITNENGGNTTTGGTLPSNFSYEGYAARLLTVQEVNRACNITLGSDTVGELDSCNYLIENTKYSKSSLTFGYWLEDASASYSHSAWCVSGSNRRGNTNYVSSYRGNGVRPAIEVLKTDISY